VAAIVETRALAEERADPVEKEVIRTWHDPEGLWGFLVTVQNGPIFNRLAITIFAFFLLAGAQALLMRTQLAAPESGLISPELYNQLFTMHGSTMIFIFATPMMEAIAEFLLPMLLGTRELPFPRLTAFLYWVLLFGSVMFYASFLFNQAPDVGWFAYVPLSAYRYSPGLGVDFWLLGLDVAQIAALGDGVELGIAILKMKAPGMSINRMPLFLWSVLVMAAMLLFGFTPLLVATAMLQVDRHFGGHFFDPQAGGDPLLWQHLFWIFGHPDVYVMFIPATGIVSMIVATFARRPVVGYAWLVASMVATGFLAFGLWVHHMFATGLPQLGMAFFTVASMGVAIPSGIQIFAWLATLWTGRPSINTPMLFVLGFIVTFVLGGLSGVMVAVVPFDQQVHDSFFVVAHFHYVLIGGVVFPVFAGLHYWMPKATGRLLNERLGAWTFWLMFVGFNVAFFPMHLAGLLGMPRRVYTYLPGLGLELPNLVSTVGAYVLGLGIALFVVNFALSIALKRGQPAGDNPWDAGSLDWSTPTPPPHEGNLHIPIVRSREPLWQQEGLHEGDPATKRAVDGLAREPRTWRATLVTTLVDARPEGILHMARPSPLPLVVALAVMLAFGAELFDAHAVAALGVVVMVAGLVVWFWPSREEREHRLAGDGTELHGLPVYLNGTAAPPWWGALFVVLILAIGFACLHFSYYYLMTSAPTWPPAGVPRPGLFLPTVAVGLGVASWVAARAAESLVRGGSRNGLLLASASGLLLQTAFLAVLLVDVVAQGGTMQGTAYGSAFVAIEAFQVVITAGTVVMSAVVLVQAWLGYFSRVRFLAVQNNAMLWLFLAANWLVSYAVIDLTPYVLPK
jgi:cytochrome c oxidase subunit I+III